MVKDHSDCEGGNPLPPHALDVRTPPPPVKCMMTVLCLSLIAALERKEGNVLFNDALNTFYLRLYGVGHMVKDHSDNKRGNPLSPISSKGYFIRIIPTDRITHTTAFVTAVVEHWLEREIAQWVHPMKDRTDDPSLHERTPYKDANIHSQMTGELRVFKAVDASMPVV